VILVSGFLILDNRAELERETEMPQAAGLHRTSSSIQKQETIIA